MNLWQNGQFSWNIFFFSRNIWAFLELIYWRKKETKKEEKNFTIRLSTRRIYLNKLTFEPHDYQIYYVNINMECLSLSCKRLSRWNVSSREQGQMAVFTGSDGDSLTDIFNLITVKSVFNLANLYWAAKSTEYRVLFIGSFLFW